jgi:hypothetical protein
MAVTMPKIDITFVQKATSLISRSERGIAILIVKDNTDKTFTFKQYSDLPGALADETSYTTENFAAISDMLAFTPFKTYVFRMDAESNVSTYAGDGDSDAVGTETPRTLSSVLDEISRTVKTGWITIAGMTAEDSAALASWIKSQEARSKSYKGVVYQASIAPDSMHVVNFVNESVTFADDRGKQPGTAYLPSLAAIFACCNVVRGCTNYLCSNLKFVEEVADNDTALGEGKFILFVDEDGDVRIGQGINSMTTTDGKTRTEDMKFIETVEAMDLMRDDIAKTFRTEYLGNYRNSRDNQMLFIAALNNSYFRQLAQENILDPAYANAASIDVEAQRAAWMASGKTEAADWDDDKVRAMAFKRTVYLTASVKILGSMTDLILPINMA